ncbi:hypothetical protein FHS19_002373 [Paenibacillus rhizosphaerae]|uniref:Lipoprotein n=1 Tax=Paenibacillus rhizosphaerae TaxID=297318 RepID=A0A839TQX8_9BACL|nr:hypothetical protein [Paenibacillus rhizosphaerae]MBB3127719.1 hypothetical protein [Paenibacillus rhizosphaerae]
MKSIITAFLLSVFILAGCSQERNAFSSPLYQGRSLMIGVIGDVPVVRESNVTLKQMTFDDLEKGTPELSGYDAVFIMKEQLPVAASPQHAKIYKLAGIPFFFFESSKILAAYIDATISYQDFPDTLSGFFVLGYDGGTEHQFGSGLYNDTKNETNIRSAYSDIFRRIETGL